jgi:hypothetical protein
MISSAGNGRHFVFLLAFGRATLGQLESIQVSNRTDWMKFSGMARIAASVATALMVCSAIFAQADQTQAKPQPSQTTKKTTSQIHHTAKLAPSKSHAHTSKASSASHRGKKSRKVSHRGQEKIDSERAQQIQEALIRQHYLSGEATGKWDAATEDALRRFQADNGWQNKTVPDSRALIKLGLGPSHDHLLNPESAMTTAPDSPHTPATPAASPATSSATGPSSQPQQR